MPVADLADPFEVARRWREAAAGVLHRLQEHRSNGVGALEEDRLLDPVGGPAAEGLRVVGELGVTVEIGVGDPEAARGQRFEVLLHGGQAGDGQGAVRGAVIGDRAADHLVLLGLADQLEVLLRGLPRRLHCLSPACGEEDAVQIAGREVGDPLGQLGLNRGGVAPHREVRQLGGLLGGHLGQLSTPVPDLDDEQPRQPVQDLPALVVPDVGALPAGDDRDGGLRVAALAGEVHPKVVCGAGRRRVGYAGRRVLDRSGHPRLLMASIGKGVRRSGKAQGDAPWLEQRAGGEDHPALG